MYVICIMVITGSSIISVSTSYEYFGKKF